MKLRWRYLSCAKAVIFPIVLIMLWEVVVRLKLVAPSQSAVPSDVLVTLFRLIASGMLLQHALYSLARLVLGVSIGAVAGVAIGVFLASNRKSDRFLSPTLQFLAGVPIVLWMPFCVMFFGTEEAFKISLAAICAFFITGVLTLQAVRLVEKQYIELAMIYGRNYWEKVREIYLPSSSPAIFAALRMSLIIMWIILFFVEYASATPGREGLGWFIADARAVGKIEEEFAGLFFLGLLAFGLDRVVAKIQRRLSMWTDSLETELFGGPV